MIVPKIHRFDAVTSTNDVAIELAHAGALVGTIVVASRQTRGKGRRGRTWLDEPGSNILMSAVLAENRPPSEYSQLSFTASLAVAELLRSKCGLPAEIKWPNDVVVRGRKIAGILVEIALTRVGSTAVVGIGLNVRQTSFPDEIADIATSIALQGGSCTDVDELIEALTESLFSIIETSFEEILARWRKYMWGIGKRAAVHTEGNIITGVIGGVDSIGALLLDLPNGARQSIVSADVLKLVTNHS